MSPTEKPITLTARQKQIYELRHSVKPAMPFRKMAKILGISAGAVGDTYLKTCRKMKRMEVRMEMSFDDPDREPPQMTKSGKPSLEETRPEVAAALLDEVAQPDRLTIAELGRKYGVPSRTMHWFMERIDKQYRALVEEVRRPRLEELVDLTGARAKAVLQSITPEDIQQASLRDKAVAIGILVEKHLLLEGRPTQIIETREEDQALDRVVGFMLEEAKRRGMTFDLDPVTGAINAIHGAQDTRAQGTGRQHMIASGELDTPTGG